MTETGRPDVDVVPRRARRLVAVVVVLLLVPAVVDRVRSRTRPTVEASP